MKSMYRVGAGLVGLVASDMTRPFRKVKVRMGS